ncbi:MAG TPA: hypothetical protein VFB34_12630 [Chloroflexota bacterium]|nr:hypothetical protein [Chloroflexota bacterium]
MAAVSRGGQSFDVVVVGAGPAGLFAAYSILSRDHDASLLLIDAGDDFEARLRGEAAARSSPQWLQGFGGAGFFIGGRMSFDLDTLSGRPSTCDLETGRRLAGEVDRLLGAWGAEGQALDRPPEPLRLAAARASEAGLRWQLNYPARHLSQEDRMRCLTALRHQVEAGPNAQLLSRTRVEGITSRPGGFALELTVEGRASKLTAERVLLAPGRAGAAWLAQTLMGLGLTVRSNPSVGVRVETRRERLASLTDLTPDPRLLLDAPEGTFRTYAFVTGGDVSLGQGSMGERITCRPSGTRAGENTSFAVLCQSREDGTSPATSPAPGVQRLDRLTQALGFADSSLLQSSDSTGATVEPTLSLAAEEIVSHWPQAFWDRFVGFLEAVDRLVEGRLGADALVYSPAIEEVWEYDLGAAGETALSGMYLAGDGAGISQGAMAAAVSGLVAAEAIAGRT